ncbi:Rsp5p-dependent ubiquitination, sorting of cargo proteins at the multivesicular body [Gonapodya sp. JEL0774]|nr:Rsp5p-dependent ubiquitination, sorting of cargo proteins at the multivesicular body [Gonapodya sp. JEL0774]
MSSARNSLDEEEPTDTEMALASAGRIRFLVDADLDADERGLDVFTMNRHRIAPSSVPREKAWLRFPRINLIGAIGRSVVTNIPITASQLTPDRPYYYFEVLISEVGGKTPEHILAAMDEYLVRTAIANSLTEGGAEHDDHSNLPDISPSPSLGDSISSTPTSNHLHVPSAERVHSNSLHPSASPSADSVSIRSGRSGSTSMNDSISTFFGRRRKYDYDAFLEDLADSGDSDTQSRELRRVRSAASEGYISSALKVGLRGAVGSLARSVENGSASRSSSPAASPVPSRRFASVAGMIPQTPRASTVSDPLYFSTVASSSHPIHVVSALDPFEPGVRGSPVSPSASSSSIATSSMSTGSVQDEAPGAGVASTNIVRELAVDGPPDYSEHLNHQLAAGDTSFTPHPEAPSTQASSPLPSSQRPRNSSFDSRVRRGRDRSTPEVHESLDIPPFGMPWAGRMTGAHQLNSSTGQPKRLPVNVHIGLVTRPYPSFCAPGHLTPSVGLWSDSERSFVRSSLNPRKDEPSDVPLGGEWVVRVGDVVGVGLEVDGNSNGRVWFTRNGKRLRTENGKGEVFVVPVGWELGVAGRLFACVGADGPAQMLVNFGNEPFLYTGPGTVRLPRERTTVKSPFVAAAAESNVEVTASGREVDLALNGHAPVASKGLGLQRPEHPPEYEHAVRMESAEDRPRASVSGVASVGEVR